MVRYIEWLSADDIILDSKYMIKTIKDLYVNKHHILKDEKYNPCNVRLIAVAIRHILLLDIDDESLTDMIDNIEFKINDDEDASGLYHFFQISKCEDSLSKLDH